MKRARPSVDLSAISILDAMADENLFGAHFKDTATWAAWRCFLSALFGLPLSGDDPGLFRECTRRTEPETSGYREAWLVVGRRGGKSFALSIIAVYLACFRDWRPYLAAGERATVMVIAADRRQARVIMRYCKGLFRSVPMLSRLVLAERAEAIDLANRVTVEVHSASFRTTRGYSIAAALCDEIAFWPSDESAAQPDFEVLNALRPGRANIPGSLLLCASSPYARKGALWEAYRRHHGIDGDPVLVWQASTRTMNPSIPQTFIDGELERDHAAASAEYLAQFRSDVEALVPHEIVNACISQGVRERPRVKGVRYAGFVDPSGGSADSFTLAIAHREGTRAVLDAVRERKPPFSPDAVVEEWAQLLKAYGLTSVTGDRYGGEWPAERFRAHRITYRPADKPKSELYLSFVPLLNAGRVDLLDLPRLTSQLCGLERRTSRGGRDIVDHAPGAHDDVANAVAGAILGTQASRGISPVDYLGDDEPAREDDWRRRWLEKAPWLGALG